MRAIVTIALLAQWGGQGHAAGKLLLAVMTYVAITILAQMPCPIPVVKVVVGSIPGSAGFLVLLAQGGGPKT